MWYPLSSPNALSSAAIDAGVSVLRSGRTTMGPHVAAFEQQIAACLDVRHAVMVNSGSSANLLAVEALMRPSSGSPAWKVGEEVLVPALAWSTTVFPLIQLGLRPVFCDVDPETLAIDLRSVQRMRSPSTTGVMLIHVLGLPADVDSIATWCDLHGLELVEDCCEAFGAEGVGQSGVVSTFSHFYSHQLTTMEGGTVVTDDDALADDLRSMRSHGWTRPRIDKDLWHATHPTLDPSFCFVTTGYNVRPLEIQGAMGVEQLHGVDAMRQERRLAAETIRAVLAPLEDVQVVGSETGACRMNVPLLVSDRARFVALCAEVGIETRPIIAGNLLRHPVLLESDYRRDACPVADRVMAHGVMIGCHAGVHDALDAFQALVSRWSVAA